MNVIGKPVEASTSLVSNDTTIPTTAYVNQAKNTPQPTLVATTIVASGGLNNGNFELAPTFVAVQTATNFIDGTAAGSATVDQYGWYVYRTATAVSVRFDPTVSHSGISSLKLSTTDATGSLYAYLGNVTPSVSSLYVYPLIKASTKYRISGWVKTNNVATDAVYIVAGQYDTSAVAGTAIYTSKLSGTNDWSFLSATFTSDADAGGSYIRIGLSNSVAGNISDAWFDDIKLEEIVEDTSYTGMIPAPLLSTITGVTSTNSIDQYSATTDATAPIGDSGASEYIEAQGFTPTKSKLTGITFSKAANVGSPTGNFRVSIRTDNSNKPSTTSLASYEFTLAEYNALSNGEVFVSLPCIVTPGALHWIVFYDTVTAEATNNNFRISTLTTGTYTGGQRAYSTNAEAAWTLDAVDIYFKTHFAKNTQNITIISNGDNLSLSTNEDGILSDAIIDLDKGKYLYNGATSLTETDKVTDIYDATLGVRVDTFLVLKKWTETITLRTATYFQAPAAVSTGAYITWKVNTLLPIKHVNMLVNHYCNSVAHVRLIQVSLNNIDWITIGTETGATGHFTKSYDTDAVNNATVFYIRAYHDTTSNLMGFGIDNLNIDLDTASVKSLITYPLTTNQFTEEVIAPSTVTRIYYRLNKFTNKNGIIVPHLELTDGSAVFINAIPIPIDNSLETNPAINIIIANTTNAQQVGTGANDSTTGYILNNGEYMTLSTAVSSLKITYKVGGGTDAFSNITKNVIYLSSNASDVSAIKDSSLQFTATVWNKVQSISRTITDLTKKVNNVINKTPEGEWQNWTPTLTWTTGTPTGAVMTNIYRWMKIGKTVFIQFIFTASDSNGCTGLTFTVPIPTTSNATYQSLQCDVKYNTSTAWAKPICSTQPSSSMIYLIDNFPTVTDGQKVYVYITGYYEID